MREPARPLALGDTIPRLDVAQIGEPFGIDGEARVVSRSETNDAPAEDLTLLIESAEKALYDGSVGLMSRSTQRCALVHSVP